MLSHLVILAIRETASADSRTAVDSFIDGWQRHPRSCPTPSKRSLHGIPSSCKATVKGETCLGLGLRALRALRRSQRRVYGPKLSLSQNLTSHRSSWGEYIPGRADADAIIGASLARAVAADCASRDRRPATPRLPPRPPGFGPHLALRTRPRTAKALLQLSRIPIMVMASFAHPAREPRVCSVCSESRSKCMLLRLRGKGSLSCGLAPSCERLGAVMSRQPRASWLQVNAAASSHSAPRLCIFNTKRLRVSASLASAMPNKEKCTNL